MNDNVKKEDLMIELLERYEQRDSMTIPCSKLIIEKYINKLELQLIKKLGGKI